MTTSSQVVLVLESLSTLKKILTSYKFGDLLLPMIYG